MTLRGSGRPPPSLEDVDRVFLALAHEARRQMLILLGQCGGELPSGYLAARFPHSWPTTRRAGDSNPTSFQYRNTCVANPKRAASSPIVYSNTIPRRSCSP